MRRASTLLLAGIFLMPPGWGAAQVVPLMRAHAHNDYEHERPLLDALDHGFMSIEVDIFLIDDALLVAHEREEVDPSRTIETLYLEPFRRRIEENGGYVYAGVDAPVILLIDLKSDAEATYRALRKRLASYEAMFTRFTPEGVDPGPVLAVISGNRPRASMEAETVRWAAYDGRLEDLSADSLAPASFIPLVSSHWYAVTRGEAGLTDEARTRLDGWVKRAHQQGRKLRFWGTPDTPAVWQVLYDAGVDLINTDDLAGLRRFLLERH